jgi:hypothetical protein
MVRESLDPGRRSLGRRSSTSRRRSQRRLRRRGAMAQAPPLTPSPGRATRLGRGNGEKQGRVRLCPVRIRDAEREANAKWLEVRPPTTDTKQHVRLYVQPVSDELFLNRVAQVRILPGAPRQSRALALSCAFVVRPVARDSSYSSTRVEADARVERSPRSPDVAAHRRAVARRDARRVIHAVR